MAIVFGLEAVDLVVLLLAGFAGGAFGASVGALPAFCFTGFTVMIGEAANVLASELGEVSSVPAGEIAVGITGSIAFGPVFGPHVAFAGGVAAAAYAAKFDGMYEPDDGDYHPAKDIAYALGTRPDILAVGGLFGVLGVAIRQTSQGLVLPLDPIAVGVIGSAIVSRVVFSYPVVGTVRGRGLLDMSPFENGDMRTATNGGSSVSASGDEDVATDGGVTFSRPAVEPWLPHQYKWSGVVMIGLVAGLLGGYIALVTGSALLAFGISAASLTFLNLGVEQFPVTHHITLPSSFVAVMATTDPANTSALLAGLGQPGALVLAGAFGIFGAAMGEILQRIFYAHSDTHFDPPAASIIVTTLCLGVLAVLGVLPGIGTIPGTL